mmetsp:Transcript_12451/g.37967  ORF Transcript_12451/g.37967 Transcript_12451/m.37967 type:complete len:222 (-) Transcript_12451:37-702(-)
MADWERPLDSALPSVTPVMDWTPRSATTTPTIAMYIPNLAVRSTGTESSPPIMRLPSAEYPHANRTEMKHVTSAPMPKLSPAAEPAVAAASLVASANARMPVEVSVNGSCSHHASHPVWLRLRPRFLSSSPPNPPSDEGPRAAGVPGLAACATTPTLLTEPLLTATCTASRRWTAATLAPNHAPDAALPTNPTSPLLTPMASLVLCRRASSCPARPAVRSC